MIDPDANTLIDTIPVGGETPDGLAFDPTTGDIYVADAGSSSVSVINPG